MRIATYNIWNKDILWLERLDAICEEIKHINPDILAMQEVKTFIEGENGIYVAQHIAAQTGYPYCIFKEYPDSPDEGLAILSKIPLCSDDAIWYKETEESNYCAIRITFKYDNREYGITNVHLNWKSIAIREEQLRTVNEWIFEDNKPKPIEILCGDFNDDPGSAIHQYLTNNFWLDVVQYMEAEKSIKPQPTLDYINNPYLKNDSDIKNPARYDWILIHKNEVIDFPVIKNVWVFGNFPVAQTKVLPSDHYGVLMDFT